LGKLTPEQKLNGPARWGGYRKLMPSKIRLQRISDRIREELSEMLVKNVQDPRLLGVSVTDVKVDRELAYADVFVSAVEGKDRSKEVLEGLERARGFLRTELAARVDLRVFPRLRFHWDPTPERADHIERVLASLRSEEEARKQENDLNQPATEEDEEDGA
jgi:ribosome-binding factor A